MSDSDKRNVCMILAVGIFSVGMVSAAQALAGGIAEAGRSIGDRLHDVRVEIETKEQPK